ncbi:putative ctr copper transporter family protein [Golovinomyces cichoracearum]|uniref:Putative ctr copper transporter family protein n=1 Tax=Golovinomyces cichoracearum TaxID=62708 RepID=A0A420IWN2_9PEZI|nr:putative ctr copper transporter family protein [Golovinomyces cichoracearum]
MQTMLLFHLLLGGFNVAQGAIILGRSGPSCSEFRIPVTVSVENMKIDPNINSVDSLRGAMQGIALGTLKPVKVKIQDTYNIAARYCEPEVQNPNRTNTIQMLVHGITYSKDYWSGLGPPGAGYDGNTYSWIAYASTQGYPTLSIDRLGNGASDRPDGLSVVQMGTHVEITQTLINALKNGEIGGRSFQKVIYVGHWYGSLIGNLHAVKYPNTVDSYVLTGFTQKIRPSLVPTLTTGVFLPAAVAYPQRWNGQASTYFASSDEQGGNKLFFVNETSDPAFRSYNFALRGTVTVGEFISAYSSTQVAPLYRGRIFVLTGQNDSIFCSPGELGEGTIAGKGDCGTGMSNLAATTRQLYPAVSVYDFNTPANTGHCNILHKNAQEQFAVVHNWLNRFY